MRSVRFRLHFLIGKRSMNKLTIKACPVCGGTHLERTLTCIDHYASGEAFHLCRCGIAVYLYSGFSCGSGNRTLLRNSRLYFPLGYEKGAMNSVYHRVRSYMLKRKARLVAHEAHRKTGRLLDIGTGTGYFADTMNRAGWQVEAVEKNAGARVFAKESFRMEVKPDTALKDFEPGSFDVITLWHVMEHLEDMSGLGKP